MKQLLVYQGEGLIVARISNDFDMVITANDLRKFFFEEGAHVGKELIGEMEVKQLDSILEVVAEFRARRDVTKRDLNRLFVLRDKITSFVMLNNRTKQMEVH